MGGSRKESRKVHIYQHTLTLVEALISGRKAVGVDINPVAWLITKAKAVPIEPEKLKKEVNKILSDISTSIKVRFNSQFERLYE